MEKSAPGWEAAYHKDGSIDVYDEHGEWICQTTSSGNKTAQLIAAAGTAARNLSEMGYDPIKLLENLPLLVLSLENWANGRTPNDIVEAALLTNFAISIAIHD